MKRKLYIEGMTCEHCVRRVKNALEDMDGVKSAQVNLDEKYSLVELSKDIDQSVFNEVIDDAGYDLTRLENID